MTGRAAVFVGPNRPFEMREYPAPDPAPDAVVVKVSLANICGSDLHFWRGKGPKVRADIPQVLGHEMVGVVHKLGRGVTRDSAGQPLREGDRIAYAYFSPCGACAACLTGTPGCPNRYRNWLNVSADAPPHFHGAFGDYYYLRRSHWVFKVPEGLPDRSVSPVNCALSEALYGLNQIGVMVGDAVVIQGAGGLGLYATAIAREMGAGLVITMDRLADRLALAEQFGADRTLNVEATTPEERVEQVRAWSGGAGADVVAEFTGSPAALDEGTRMLRFGGRYLWIGNISPGFKAEVDPGLMVRGSQRAQGVIVYEAWAIPRALDLIRRTQGRYPFDRVVSHVVPFERINEAFALAAEGKAIRVALEM
jgi:threonine dehydrogenase-like Zn-dependent dehydrogenase